MKYFLKYTTHNEYEESFIQTTPQVSLCKKENHVNYKETKSLKAQYFTVESLEDNNVITLYQGTQTNVITIKVSIDDGNTWTSFTSSANTSQTLGTLNKGQRMLFKGTNTRINSGSKIATAIRILTSKTCNLLGNLCSIINENTFETLTNSPNYNYCFAHMFATNVVDEEELSCKVVDASKLLILEPSTTGGNYSYYQTFYACSTLKIAPKSLGSNMKAHYLYAYMFKNCTNLIKAPELPSLTVYTQGYLELFSGCTSLETAPYIAATSLFIGGSAHFQGMFLNCTNLKNVQDELQLNVINNSTYYQMFMNCSSLTKAPKWHTGDFRDSSFSLMFSGCTSLTEVEEFDINYISGSNSCLEMFKNCTSLESIKFNINTIKLGNQSFSGMFSGCTSLITVDADLSNITSLPAECYSYMFNGCINLINAPTTFTIDEITGISVCYSMYYNCKSLISTNIKIRATNTTNNCFRSMFNGCENIIDTGITNLPATSINQYSYSYMFNGCYKLTKFPSFTIDELLNTHCCYFMFGSCRSLTFVNCKLNATTLTNSCYQQMFSGCTSLTHSPISILPATTLAESCYQAMFDGCTNMITSPELPALTLVKNCYYALFRGTKVQSVKAAFTTTPSTTYTNSWLNNVENTKTHIFFKNPEATWNVRSEHGIPTNWTVEIGMPKENYLKFMVLENDSSLVLEIPEWFDSNALYYVNLDLYRNNELFDNSEYNNFDNDGTGDSISYIGFSHLLVGDIIEVYGQALNYGHYSSTDNENADRGCRFNATGQFVVYDNILSLFNDDKDNWPDYDLRNNLGPDCLRSIFFNCNIKYSHDLILDAPTLVSNCYCAMFKNCSSLITVPQLPATTLADNCYYSMFHGCTSLTIAPQLPATILVDACYQYMFYNCTSLTTAPELPATTLASTCYQYMFYNCTSLTTAPELPALQLASGCYWGMFYSCTSLIDAPELPATTLVSSCYNYMFKGCTNLNYIKAMFTTTPGIGYTREWVSDVANTGEFVCNYSANWSVNGVNGIPNGWHATSQINTQYQVVDTSAPNGITNILYSGNPVISKGNEFDNTSLLQLMQSYAEYGYDEINSYQMYIEHNLDRWLDEFDDISNYDVYSDASAYYLIDENPIVLNGINYYLWGPAGNGIGGDDMSRNPYYGLCPWSPTQLYDIWNSYGDDTFHTLEIFPFDYIVLQNGTIYENFRENAKGHSRQLTYFTEF